MAVNFQLRLAQFQKVNSVSLPVFLSIKKLVLGECKMYTVCLQEEFCPFCLAVAEELQLQSYRLLHSCLGQT